jgi:MFS family permease
MFGYLGDRYNRKVLILLGIAVWISAVLACTFVPQGPVGDRSKVRVRRPVHQLFSTYGVC